MALYHTPGEPPLYRLNQWHTEGVQTACYDPKPADRVHAGQSASNNELIHETISPDYIPVRTVEGL
jgi:hypothetical protein